MSVATSTSAVPARNASRVRVRWLCALSPWIAFAPIPALRRNAWQLVGAVLGAGEDERLAGRLGVEDRRQHVALLELVGCDDDVLDALGGLGTPADIDRRVAGERAAGEGVDLGRDRRREEQRLPLVRQRPEDAPHVGGEPHVEHAVRFVQHQHFELGVIAVAALHMIEQPAGRGDDDVHAAGEGFGLRLHADATVHRGAFERDVPAVGARALQHLLGELPGRHEDQRPQRARPVLRAEPLQDRQQERGGLAGAGLGRSDDVAARQGEGDGFLLNGGGALVSFFEYGAHQLGHEPERGKWHGTPTS